MRLTAFIIALLLLAGTVDPTRGWLIALVVMSGLAAFHIRGLDPTHWRPAFDLRLASFIVAVLLLAGTVDATKDWFIALSIVSGLAAFMPGLLSLDGNRHDRWSRHFGQDQWRYFGSFSNRRARQWNRDWRDDGDACGRREEGWR